MKVRKSQAGEKGYVLVSVMLLITVMIIAMSMQINSIVQQIKRDREEELVYRGKDYARAVKRFYHKQGVYPSSVDQLLNTNNLRFLRKKYKDPITGEEEWHLVRLGEAQVKIPAPNPNMPNTLTPSPLPGQANAPGTGSIVPATSGGQAAGTPAQLGGGTPGQMGTLKTSNIGSGQSLGGAPIIGVASNSKGEGIKAFNEKTHYNEWLIVYDPRLEQAGGDGITVAEPSGAGALPPGSLGTAPGVTQPPAPR
ncbi:MAG: hypothetical protein LAO20_16410 [Acidobacteriia bacterium]|nr:hypothetical protein [Terriglobia bacterium]